MRTTARTLACDRCELKRQVVDFSWGGLHAATSEGWVKYAAVTAQKRIDQHKYKDLCPACAKEISDVMAGSEWVTPDEIRRYLRYLSDENLTGVRDWCTRELKERRRQG